LTLKRSHASLSKIKKLFPKFILKQNSKTKLKTLKNFKKQKLILHKTFAGCWPKKLMAALDYQRCSPSLDVTSFLQFTILSFLKNF